MKTRRSWLRIGSVCLMVMLVGTTGMASMSANTVEEGFTDLSAFDAETGSPDISTDPGSYIEGTSGVVMTNGSATVDVTGQPDNVWVQIFTKPAGMDRDPTESDYADAAAAFYVTTGNVLRARNGSGWTDLATDVTAGAWHGFVAHLDYVNDEWDLYRTTTYAADGGVTMTRLNGTAMTFANGNTLHSMSNITVHAKEATTYVDAYRLTPGASSAGNPYYGTVVARTLTASDSQIYVDAVPYPDQGTAATIGSSLGEALAEGLANGDAVQIWATGAQRLHTWNGTAWTDTYGGIYQSVEMDPGDTLWLDYASTKNAFRYFAQGLDPEQTEEPLASGTRGVPVAGDGNFTPHTYIGDEGTASAIGITAGALGVSASSPGDLYVLTEDNPNVPIRYRSNGSAFYQDGRVVNPSIPRRATIWMRRANAGDTTITITN